MTDKHADVLQRLGGCNITIIDAYDEIVRLRLALRIIAGEEQGIDNLMSHREIARAALSAGK